jgi:RND family efflux transporter MFP subunit
MRLGVLDSGFRFVLLSSFLAGCHAEKKTEREPVPVRVEAAQPAGAAAGARYSANIQPREQVSLAFKSGGYVREVMKVRGEDGRLRNVQQGDTVSRGTVLARVRETDYAEKVNQARAQLSEAASAFEKQRLDFARSKALYESKSLSKADFDGATSTFEQARARVEGAKAQLESAQIALNDCALASPIDGLVLARNVEEGTLVGSGTAGFTLADTTSVKAIFGVPDMIVHDLKIGEPVGVSVEALSSPRLSGRITAIAASADTSSRVFDVEVTIPNRDGRLRSGMIAAIEMPSEAAAAGGTGKATATAVPLTAIVKSPSDPNGYAVFVVTQSGGDSVARLREVKLGGIVGNQIAVTSGLATGERVIITGTTIVTDGMPVRVIP